MSDKRLSDEELAVLDALVADKRASAPWARLLREYQELRALLATPWPEGSQFDLIPLDGGVYLSNRDDDGIEDIPDEHLVGIGAALIRAGLAARGK